jgi:hypothetical protein
MKKVFFLFILLIRASWISAQDKDASLDPIIKTIQEADAKGLAAYFNTTVELKLPEHEDNFSASQGEMMMKDFFKKFPPDSFTIVQKGSTDSVSRFAICNYLSGSVRYQVYLDMRKENEKFLIHKIKFEEKK